MSNSNVGLYPLNNSSSNSIIIPLSKCFNKIAPFILYGFNFLNDKYSFLVEIQCPLISVLQHLENV